MKSLTITQAQAGKKIDRVLRDAFPQMPVNALFKAFRKKDIKANGVRIKEDYICETGDVLEVFIIDDILFGSPTDKETQATPGFSVVYEDYNLLIANKPQGVPVHPDREQAANTLIDMVQRYLEEKGEYDPSSSDFAPALCHRLDRNTAGLVMIAKNAEALRILLLKIKNKEIKKLYQCLVKGEMEKKEDRLKAYLVKLEQKSMVYVDDHKSKGAVEIITHYRVLSYENDISRLEVALITGKTHQIRAHLAHIGHPIIGDGKYGTNAINRMYGAKYQALCAYKIIMDFKDAGMLNYLKGKEFEITPIFKIK